MGITEKEAADAAMEFMMTFMDRIRGFKRMCINCEHGISCDNDEDETPAREGFVFCEIDGMDEVYDDDYCDDWARIIGIPIKERE